MGESSNPDYHDLKYEDPNDFIYVSKRHYQRKLNLNNSSNSYANIMGRPGPIAGIIFYLFDTAVVFVLKILFIFLKISGYAFDFVMGFAFKNFTGIMPTANKNSQVITSKFFRYAMTVMLPPIGILMGKGFYGWFSVLICVILTYINYMAGIIYAFVITSRNRYADQYEKWEITYLKSKTMQPNEANIEDDSALFTIITIVVTIIASVVLIILKM